MSIISGRYGMTAEIWTETKTQDPDSGAIIRTWTYDRTITCEARTMYYPKGARNSLKEKFNKEYIVDRSVAMSFDPAESLTLRDSIRNIKNATTGVLLYSEDEIAGNPGTHFQVEGVSPVTDPWGTHIENIAFLQRAEVQGG